MTPLTVLKRALSEGPPVSAGRRLSVPVQSGLVKDQLAALEEDVGAPLPSEIRELLLFSSGFTAAPIGAVSLSGERCSVLEDVFPCTRKLAADRYGNPWIIDVTPDAPEWGPVLFVSHDPPVISIQAQNMADFLGRVLRVGEFSDFDIASVSWDTSVAIWENDELLQPPQEFRGDDDPRLLSFLRGVPMDWRIADLRSRSVGAGFSWGRFGPNTRFRRFGRELLFALGPPEKSSLVSRLIGWRRRWRDRIILTRLSDRQRENRDGKS